MSSVWPEVHLAIHGRLPDAALLARLDVNPRVTAVEHGTQLPGGFAFLRVGLLPPREPGEGRPRVYPRLPEPVTVPELAHIVARVGRTVIFEGVPGRRAADETGIEAHGYGIVAPNWGRLDQGRDELVTTDRIASAALAANRWLQVGEVPASTTRHNWADLRYMATAAVIDTLAKAGSGGVPWLFTVYRDRVARLLAKTPPAVCDYRVPVDMDGVEVWFDDQDVIDAISATYQDEAGVQCVTDWFYRDGFDPAAAWPRAVTVPVSGDPALVVETLRTLLADRGAPRLTGSITLSEGRGLPVPSGAPRAGYAVESGQWVEFPGYGKTVITRTTCNHTTRSTRIDFDTPSLGTFARLLADWQEAVSAVRSRRDIWTGNRDHQRTEAGRG